jgi:uncharacterized protein (DUF427 family)
MKNRIPPQPGQESVWDYPRPPRVEAVSHRLRVEYQGVLVADTLKGYRVLETSHPPAYYIPQEDVQMRYLILTARHTFCEYKGQASYWSLVVGDDVVRDVAWMYASPNKGYEAIRDHLSFYASRVTACYVGDERVTPQEGDFYGGWITSWVVGPFKGGAGTWGW